MEFSDFERSNERVLYRTLQILGSKKEGVIFELNKNPIQNSTSKKDDS